MGMQAGFAQPGMGMQPGMGIQPGASMGYMPGERCFCLMLDLANLDVVPGMGARRSMPGTSEAALRDCANCMQTQITQLTAKPGYSPRGAKSMCNILDEGCSLFGWM